MKYWKQALFFIIVILAFICLTACNEQNGGSRFGDYETAQVQLKATVTNQGASTLTAMSMESGTMTVTSALFRIDCFELEIQVDGDYPAVLEEEDNDDDGESEDEDEAWEDEDDDGEEEDGEEGEDDEDEFEEEDGEIDMEIEGPYFLTADENELTLDEGQVVVGRFTELEVTFEPANDDPMNGHSILVMGQYTEANGTTHQVELKVEDEFEVEVDLVEMNYMITAGQSYVAMFSLDVEAWLQEIHLETAETNDGAILIDEDHNPELMHQLILSLSSHMDIVFE